MRHKFERIIFLVIILFIPIQLGKHFWLPFSYVNGIRVDYLSPTLYVTDILIIILLLTVVIQKFSETFSSVIARRVSDVAISFSRLLLPQKRARNDNSFLNSKFLLLLYFLFIIYVVLNSFLARSFDAALFGFIKLLEFSFLGFYVALKFKKQHIKPFTYLISIGAVLSSFIVFLQFIQQHSIGGILYFLGERTFNTSTPGIANMDLNGILVLRPYATFPHPNVLAFFLFIVNTILLQQFFIEKNRRIKYWYLFVLMVSTSALFLTFSRIIIALFIFMFFFVLLQHTKKKLVIIIPAILVCLLTYLFAFAYRFFDSTFLLKDWLLRWDLIEISFSIFKEHPLFGVGLNNFFLYEAPFQKTITPTLLQPVHNIYILTLVEIGIIGFLFVFIFLIKTLRTLIQKTKKIKDLGVKSFYKSTFIFFIAILIVGFFDHFFLTVQQGQLMFALILGLSWTKLK